MNADLIRLYSISEDYDTVDDDLQSLSGAVGRLDLSPSKGSVASSASSSGGDGKSDFQSLHIWLLNKNSCCSQNNKAEMKSLPVLPQKNFIHLWRSLHDVFLVQSDNSAVVDCDIQKLYHATSVVGTLLLQIGEVGQKLLNEKREGGNLNLNGNLFVSIFYAK